MELHGKTWFIKNDGKITGPFGADTVFSMLDRGRLTRASLLSSDRSQWLEAGSVESLFPDNDVPMVDALPPEDVLTDSTQYFYNENGQRQGPVTFSRLNEMAVQGKILATDLIWFEGSPGWVPAASVTSLQFVSVEKTASTWARKNKALVCFGVASLLMVVILPSWYVISSDRARVKNIEERKTVLLAQQEAEKQRQLELTVANYELEADIRKIAIYAAEDAAAKRKHDELVQEQARNTAAIVESQRKQQEQHDEYVALTNKKMQSDAVNAATTANATIQAGQTEANATIQAGQMEADATDRLTDELRRD